jgi:hypothetical protein
LTSGSLSLALLLKLDSEAILIADGDLRDIEGTTTRQKAVEHSQNLV